MKRYMICDLSSKLYVSECVPETKALNLTSDRAKASVYMDIDANLIKSYAEDSTGLKFEMIQV